MRGDIGGHFFAAGRIAQREPRGASRCACGPGSHARRRPDRGEGHAGTIRKTGPRARSIRQEPPRPAISTAALTTAPDSAGVHDWATWGAAAPPFGAAKVIFPRNAIPQTGKKMSG